MKKIQIFILLLIIVFGVSCDGYKDYKQTYSPSYPLCGIYIMKQYANIDGKIDTAQSGAFEVHVYSTSKDPKKQVWVNRNLSSLRDSMGFMVKCQYNIDNLTFGGEMLEIYQENYKSDKVQFFTIKNSKLERKDWPLNDSLIFNVIQYDSVKNEVMKFFISGHRRSGFEEPFYDDETGQS